MERPRCFKHMGPFSNVGLVACHWAEVWIVEIHAQKRKKEMLSSLHRQEKKNLKRNRECSMAPWIDNEHPCNVLKAFVPYMRQNSLEMTSTHVLAVLIYQAQLWCWPSAESLGRLCCNKPQQWARFASRKSHQPVPVALWELHGVRRPRRPDHDTRLYGVPAGLQHYTLHPLWMRN